MADTATDRSREFAALRLARKRKRQGTDLARKLELEVLKLEPRARLSRLKSAPKEVLKPLPADAIGRSEQRVGDDLIEAERALTAERIQAVDGSQGNAATVEAYQPSVIPYIMDEDIDVLTPPSRKVEGGLTEEVNEAAGQKALEEEQFKNVVMAWTVASPAVQHRLRGVFSTPQSERYHCEVFGDIYTEATPEGFNQWLEACITEGSAKYKGPEMTDEDRDFCVHAIQHFRDFFGGRLTFNGPGPLVVATCTVTTREVKNKRRFYVRVGGRSEGDDQHASSWSGLDFPILSFTRD